MQKGQVQDFETASCRLGCFAWIFPWPCPWPFGLFASVGRGPAGTLVPTWREWYSRAVGG